MPIELSAEATEKAGQGENTPRQFRENPFAQQRKMVEENLKEAGKVIAVHSGKGGVGKSTFSVNLAASLSKMGFKTGLVDADVDCPSCHRMLGKSERVFADEKQVLKPLEAHGVRFLSVGNMVSDENSANIMRGPIMFKLIGEMLYKADWGKLDYLIIDLPPGTGDNPLTIMQIAPLFGLIIVSQPSETALVDARKSANMAERLQVPVIGIVENMSGEIFGTGSTEKTAEKLRTIFLGSIPLDKEFPKHSDEGNPIVLKNEKVFERFKEIINEAAI